MAAYRAAAQLMKMRALHRIALGSLGCAVLSAGLIATPSASIAAGSIVAVPAHITQLIASGHLPSSAVSFVVLDADSGRVVMSHNPDTPRSPASTIKTVTTFAALDMLGPTFLWQTRALTYDGDLILQGGGDPYLTAERWWSFVQGLRASGLKSIPGDIVIDDTAFSLPKEDPGAFDGRPNRTYNALPDALMVNFQSVEFTLVVHEDTHEVDVTSNPVPVNLVVENHIRFMPGRCTGAAGRVDFQVASAAWDRVVFSGALSPHCAPRTIARILLQPATYAYGTFVKLWRESGGDFGGKLRIEPTPADAKPLYAFDSLSLAEIVRLTNKYSNNLMARHLFLTLGRERYGDPGTLEKGAAAMAEWSHERGFDLTGVDLDNGSGLSRGTRITVLQMAKILAAACHSRFAPEFLASFPLAGMDGTLRSRMKSSPAGAVRLKTGHLEGVSGVAGYVTTAAGKTYVLVSLVNNVRADFGAAEPVHAALAAWILDNL
ncbi:MAG TPA: D-alanyl-D-alanine carboxypeptidase/D-alanyl-D-alanine-endopeptidase [Steroidobacteraceae bacterium]|jgi:D-alanyl-D-alanine carboxypeptidase/D-alanyl-D-alanine-endopeptidase (penicillin-binding protein 4)|nr:D-alanyl-D-alanine carboxypeptidase/D-alanyl-D-alanine-endopeptidase [Steroidobacteraceae bacterium]